MCKNNKGSLYTLKTIIYIYIKFLYKIYTIYTYYSEIYSLKNLYNSSIKRRASSSERKGYSFLNSLI